MYYSKSDLVETEHFNFERGVSYHRDMMAFCLNLYAATFSDGTKNQPVNAPAGMERLRVFRDGTYIIGPDMPGQSFIRVDEFPGIDGEGIFRRRFRQVGTNNINDDSCVSARLGRDFAGREISAVIMADSKSHFGLLTENQDHLILAELKRLFQAIANAKTIQRALEDKIRVHFMVDEFNNIIWTRFPEDTIDGVDINDLICRAVRSLTQTAESAHPENGLARSENMKVSHLNLLDRPYRLISLPISKATSISYFKTEKTLIDGLLHKLKGKLGAILTAADYLGSGRRLSDDESGHMVGIIEMAAVQLETILNRFEEYVNLPELQAKSMDLVACVKNMASVKAAGECPIHVISSHEMLPVKSDERLMRMALSELIDNARESETNRDSIRMTLERDPELIVITISGTGPSTDTMQPVLMENIADPFLSTKPDRAGLGLTIAKRAIERLGGRLEIECSNAEGFMTRLIFPTHFMETNEK